MTRLIKGFLLAALLTFAGPALAQSSGCGGQFAAGQFCGNPGPGTGLPRPVLITPGVFQPIPGGTIIGNPTGASAVPVATTAPVLGIPGTSTGQVGLAGATSGTTILRAQDAAGSATNLLPTSPGTLVSTAAAPVAIDAVTGQVSITGLAGGVLAGSGPTFQRTPVLGVPGSALGTLGLAGNTSGTVTITPQATAGTPTLTLPNTSGTFAVGASSPVVLNTTTGNLTCPTCATTSGGGALSATAPINLSGNVISLNTNGVTYSFFQQVAAASLVGNPTGGLANAQGITLGSTLTFSGSALQTLALTGDVTSSANSFATTLATVNPNVGSFGGASSVPNFTVNAKGLITAAGATAVIAPAGTLSGTTLASNVVNSSLTSLGTLSALNVTGPSVLNGTVSAPALNTAGTIAGSLCRTSAGDVLYVATTNCFAATAASITVGTTTIANGTDTYVLFQSGASPGGTLGEYAISGTGKVAMTTSPVFTTPNLGTPSAATLTNAIGLPISGITGLGTGVGTMLGNAVSTSGGAALTIASGTLTLGTGAIASGTCATVVTATATGTATTDVPLVGFNSDPKGVTGYAPSTSGMLTIQIYPTANAVNANVCNNTGASITPGAITLNFRVVR